MTVETVGSTSLKMWGLALVAVSGIALATFSVHRYLVNSTIEEATPLRTQRDSERHAAEEQKNRGLEEQKRRDTMAVLLDKVEGALVARPMDSLLVIRAANIAYDLEDFGKAEMYYRRYLKDIDNSSISARIDLSYVIFRSGKQDDGVRMLKDVLRRDPRNQMAMFNLAFMFDQLGNKEEAKEWIEKCMNVDSTTALGRNASRILNRE